MTAFEVQDAVRKSFRVQCVQVTHDNMEQVAEWCGGEVRATTPRNPENANRYIYIDVPKAQKDRHKRAYADDWVLFMNGGYKFYNDRAFHDAYEVPERTSDVMTDPKPEDVAVVANSGSGVFWFTPEERRALKVVAAIAKVAFDPPESEAV